jgi:hypothetical protein
MAAAGTAANVLTFQFVPAVTLAVLRDGPGSHSTSFSGTVVSLPDGGTTIMLLGVGLGALGMARRFLKK